MVAHVNPRPWVGGLLMAGLVALTVVGAAGSSPAGADEGGPTACGGREVSTVAPDVRDLADDLGLDLAEAARRIGWQSRAEQLADKAQSKVKSFGGVWIDPETGRVKVGVTQATERANARSVIRQCGLSAGADVVSVVNTASTLGAVNSWLGDGIEAVGKPGFGAGIDHSSNAVVVDVPTFRTLTTDEKSLLDQAKKRYPGVVTTRTVANAPKVAACTSSNFCDPPLRGGIGINNGSFSCTLGFHARSASTGTLYSFTAGHCGGGTWATSFSNGSAHVIGPRTSGEFGPIDAQLIRVNNPAGWNPRPWVLVEASANTTANEAYPIHRIGFSTVGMRLCETGYKGGTKCGTVERLSQTVTYEDGTVVRGLGMATFCVAGGDSGGPNYATNTAYGLTSGFRAGTLLNPCRSYYQGIAGAAAKLNVYVVTGS